MARNALARWKEYGRRALVDVTFWRAVVAKGKSFGQRHLVKNPMRKGAKVLNYARSKTIGAWENAATNRSVNRAHRFAARERSIVFVTNLLRPRELKMASALRGDGWSVVLIYQRETPFDTGNAFDSEICVTSPHEALRVANALAPKLCHVFSGAVDDLITLFTEHPPCPVVCDMNDIFAPSLMNYCEERFEPTRKCLERASGICVRDLQASVARKSDGFIIPGKSVLFSEYPWTGEAQVHSFEKFPPDEVHVVSVGTFCLETHRMFDSAYLQLARMFCEQQIHFHIFPHWFYRHSQDSAFNWNRDRDFSDFLYLARESEYLHLHQCVPHDELKRILSAYDFGMVSGGCKEFGQDLKYLSPAYVANCYSGRISDYLDAGLPVLINEEVKFNYRLLAHYNALVDLKGILNPDFKSRLLEIKQDPVTQQRMDQVRRKLALPNQIGRLSSFYESVIASNDNKPGREFAASKLEPLSR